MPNIRQYNNPINGLQPDERGVSAAVASGRAISSAYHSIGSEIGGGIADLGAQYVKHQTQQEMSRGIAQYAALQQQLTEEWNKTAANADPNDPTVAQTFREKIAAPALEKFQASFETEQGKLWATERSAALGTHMFEKTTADASTMAGNAAVMNLTSLSNFSSRTAKGDPTSLPLVNGTIDSSIEAMIASNPNLSPAQAANLKTEFAQKLKTENTAAAALGMIEANPEEAKGKFAAGFGKEYLDASTIKSLDQYADTMIRARKEDERAAAAEARRKAEDDADKMAANIFVMATRPDGSIIPTPGYHKALLEYAQHPGAKASEAHALASMASTALKDQENGTFIQSNPKVYQNFMARMALPAGDPNALSNTEIYQARAKHLLSDADTQVFHNGLESKTSDPAMTQARQTLHTWLDQNKSLITKSNIFSGNDPSGDNLFSQFYVDVNKRFNQMIAAGMTPTAAADALTDAHSRSYAGLDIPRYQTSTKQGRQAMEQHIMNGGGMPGVITNTNVNRANVAPRKPGESAAAYLARTGGK